MNSRVVPSNIASLESEASSWPRKGAKVAGAGTISHHVYQCRSIPVLISKECRSFGTFGTLKYHVAISKFHKAYGH
jgi:hypothetical protein